MMYFADQSGMLMFIKLPPGSGGSDHPPLMEMLTGFKTLVSSKDLHVQFTHCHYYSR